MATGKYQFWLKPENLVRIVGWARDGLSDEQIATNMGISESTLYDWKNKHLEISKALMESKEGVDREVENALYKRAHGYDVEETVTDYDGDGNVTKVRRVKKHIPPDTGAMTLWLKNRKPKVWRDKQEVELSGNVGIADALKEACERAKAHET